MINPDDLTGAVVREIRKKHKLNITQLYALVGFPGKSNARLNNIENKDSWKPGDREMVAAALNELEAKLPENQRWVAPRAGEIITVGSDDDDVLFAEVRTETDEYREELPPYDIHRFFDPNKEAEVDVDAWKDRRVSNGSSSQFTDIAAPVDATPVDEEDESAAVTVDPALADEVATSMTELRPPQEEPGPADVSDPGGGAATSDRHASGRSVEALPEQAAGVVVEAPPVSDEAWAAIEEEIAAERPSLSAAAERDGAFLVTNGQLKTIARCPRKWWLSWYRRLELRDVPMLGVRSTGTRIHRALERYYVPEGQTPTNPRDALERVLVEDWTEVSRRAEERGLDEVAVAALWRDFEKSSSLERAMIEGYVEWLAETGVDSDLRVVASETVLTHDLPVAGMRVRVAALIDTRVQRTTDGTHLFIDHKTVGDLKTPQVTLPMDQQMLHYHLLEWLNTEGGERCDGALYNMLRRVKRTATANPPFYDRIEVRHNEQELNRYKQHLEATSRRLLNMTMALDAGADHHDVVPPNPTKDCTWDCDFVSICTMFDDGSRVEDAVTSLYHQIDPHARYDRELTKGAE